MPVGRPGSARWQQLGDPQVRARLAADGAGMGLSPAGAQAVAVALRRMDDLEAGLGPVHAQITAFARRQAGCKALARELFGVGPLVAAVVRAFLGDTRRFSSSAQAVRHTGLDVTVRSSDGKGPPGYLSHQGRRSCAGRCSRPATRAPARHPPATGITPAWPGGSTPTGPRCRSPASSPAAPTTSCAASATRPAPPCRAGEADAGGSGGPHATDAPWPSPVADAPQGSCSPPSRGLPRTRTASKDRRGHTPQRDHPIDHHVTGTSQCGSADRGKAGRPRHPHTPIPEPPPEEPMT